MNNSYNNYHSNYNYLLFIFRSENSFLNTYVKYFINSLKYEITCFSILLLKYSLLRLLITYTML